LIILESFYKLLLASLTKRGDGTMGKSEYAETGVDYVKLESFKQMMIDVAGITAAFPNKRKVFVEGDTPSFFNFNAFNTPAPPVFQI